MEFLGFSRRFRDPKKVVTCQGRMLRIRFRVRTGPKLGLLFIIISESLRATQAVEKPQGFTRPFPRLASEI